MGKARVTIGIDSKRFLEKLRDPNALRGSKEAQAVLKLLFGAAKPKEEE